MERYGSLIRDVSAVTTSSPTLLSSFCPTVTHDGDDVTMGSPDDTREYPCIIRVTNGEELKFSTHVRTLSMNRIDRWQIESLYFHHTDNIRATRQVSQRVWRITQIINDHIEKTRQKARKGSRRKAGCTKTTSRRADLHRGPQTGKGSKETTEKDQGRIEAGSGTPTLTGKAGSEGEDKCVANRP